MDGIKPAWGETDYQQLTLFLQQAGADCKARAIVRSDVLKWAMREANLFPDKKDRDRAMRDTIAQGVRSGEFPVICSGPNGYYVTQDPVQIKAAIEFLDSRVESLSIRRAGLMSAWKEARRRETECARGEPESGHRVQGTLFSAGPRR